MPKAFFESVRISGVVTCVPRQEKSIDDEVKLFGGNVRQIERLKKTIGLNRRRVVDGETTAADLCFHAARRLLSAVSISAEDIDGLICVTQTPDHLQPCNAALIHGRLGCSTDCAAMDVGLGCSGYVYGLWLAHTMVASGGCDRVLLLAGDTMSSLVHPRDRVVAPLFGDGGSATLIERSSDSSPSWFSLGTDGKGYKHLIVPAGGARMPASGATKEVLEDENGSFRCAENLFMDGAEVFNFSISVEPDSVRGLLDYAGVDIDSVDYLVFHQANRYILKNIAKRLKISEEKVPMGAVERFGNQSSASIPSAMCLELGQSLCLGSQHQVLLSGFGVGLSWASALLPFGTLSICEVVDYEV